MLVFVLMLNVVFIVGGVIVIVMAMHQRAKRLEMEHRERLAMIERGMAPSLDSEPPRVEPSLYRPGVSRYTTLGVAIVGVGIGLMLMIGVAGGAVESGIGIGGAIAVLGAAFIVNGYLRRNADHMTPPRAPSLPAAAPDASGIAPSEPRRPLGP